MPENTWRLCGTVVLLLWALAPGCTELSAQIRDHDCGNENQQTCRVGQWERYNMRYWTENRCEYDLKPSDGICVNEKRRLLGPTGGWLGWAMQEQRYRISLDEPINKVTWLASHNAFASTNQGFNSPLYTNHVYSITDQLNWGARHLELDPHYYGSENLLRSDANRLCHASSTAACRVPGYGQRLMGFALKEIDTWLAANPDEVVVVKLNDKNADGARMREEIQARMGHRLLPGPASFQRWPTMREIRGTGRQILFMQHDVNPGINPTTWNASGLVLADNWPKSQDFDQCLDSAGNSPLNQGPHTWWDIAEGRSKLNTDLFGQLTGSLEFPAVRRATNCGVAIIGLDFIAALWSEYNVYTVVDLIDRRHEAHIWNWRVNDFGGNASFDPRDRRWTSRPASERKRLVCSQERLPGTTEQQRTWRLTEQPHPWSRIGGDTQCQAEFGTANTPYVFAFPGTALQNRLLGEFLDAQGVTEPVWIGYTSGPEDYLRIVPNEVTFSMGAGAAPPSPQGLQVLGPRGAAYKVSSNQQWLASDRPANFLPADGSILQQPLVVTSVAAELSPGTHAATFEVELPPAGTRPRVTRQVSVKLRVQVPTMTTLNGPVTVSFGTSPELEIRVSSNPSRPIDGDVELVRISPGFEQPVVQQFPAGERRTVIAEGLSVGVHRFYASYRGSHELQGSDSEAFTLTVTPRIAVAPSRADFVMTTGGSLPAAQTLQLSNLDDGATIAALGECSWLHASLAGFNGISGTLLLQPLPVALALQAADYSCRFEVSDASSSTMGSSIVEAVLRVRTSMLSIPAVIPPLLVGPEPAGSTLLLATPWSEQIPIRTASSCPELRFAPESPVTPVHVQVLASRGSRAPGVYHCELRVESDLVDTPLVLPVTLQLVDPTVVDTHPPGLTYFMDGLSYTGRHAFAWEPGSIHQVSTSYEQSSGEGTRHRFQSWSSGPSQTQSITATASGASYVATFNTEHRLTLLTSPVNAGSLSAAPFGTDGYYLAGSLVQLTATPASGFQVVGFSGVDDSSAAATESTVTMNAPRAVTARFAATELTPITIQANAPNAVFTVDGEPQPLPVTLLLEQGRQYRFVAPPTVEENPASLWVFSRWEGAAGSNVVDYLVTGEPTKLTIRFRRQVLYSLLASPPDGGAVTNNGWQLATGELPIEARPAEGYRFVRWLGDLAGHPNPVTLPVDRPLAATAEFQSLVQPALVVMPGGQRGDGPTPDSRRVPLLISNRGSGLAPAARITGITNIRVLAGSGLVTPGTALPLTLGPVDPGTSIGFELLFAWPTTATRVQFTLHTDAGDGAAPGSTTLTLFR